ncbi:bactofilin family protein [Noviherbaspirillum pedocola]|uniref:Polymer-forming cytoskeletal protein n=1 Tax=Noviherbaspirillum pedocola TaxID=2801341 RepID=A0A934W7I0_9BURK|nr:polymer-forming cytoskeletal protein [Noviherbaspirillum pedocola]MBK4734709.1 polymer-forming cytoskeletal protein [Noviherbaspirillum pedocola]
MFGQKAKNTIDSLIGMETRIEGNIQFRGGLRVDGHVRGNLIANPIEGSMLVISEQARVEGEVRAEHVVVDGEIAGPVFCTELLELQPKARITGDVNYKALEMHGGALVSGKLSHQQENEQVLKLALPKAVANT